jgi:hypothetical protein
MSADKKNLPPAFFKSKMAALVSGPGNWRPDHCQANVRKQLGLHSGNRMVRWKTIVHKRRQDGLVANM